MKEKEQNIKKDGIIQRGTLWFLFFVWGKYDKNIEIRNFYRLIKGKTYIMWNTDIENHVIKYIKLDKCIEK